MDTAREAILAKFGPLLDELAAQGYDVDGLLERWETEAGDFSPLANVLLAPPGDPVTLAALADRHGVEADFLRRAWRGLGFVDETITTGDEPVIEVLAAIRGVLGEESTLRLAAVMGQVNRRLAEAEITEVRMQREVPLRFGGAAPDDVEFAHELLALTQTYLPIATAANAIVHRRHLMLAGAQRWATDDAATVALAPRVIGFTDMAGFTARSHAADPAQLVALIRTFETTVTDVVVSGGGRVVKLIGDAVMFSTESADDACDIAVRLRESFADRDLEIGSGLAVGDVLDHGGDYFGATVNLASRLGDMAARGQILAGPGVADAASAHRFVPLGAAEVRGFDAPVECWELRPR